WRHEPLSALMELDFGRWDGLAWPQVPRDEIDAWCGAFLHQRPGGGESLHALFARVAAWQAPAAPVAIVAHAGWMLARRWLAGAQPLPVHAGQWPAAPRHGECWMLPASVALPPSAGTTGGLA
ncbi:MAG TPA: histidine phosphatase family protein, partial [Ideonella sp.]|nr:histidine phosphatase family protein [Ideonella sp.]